MAEEMTKIIESQRALTYALKVVTTSDEIEGTINQLRG
jgi:flagellar basal-body rod protein FlgG